MPEESIATYNNNITSFIAILIVSAFIFFVLFILSRIFILRNKQKYSENFSRGDYFEKFIYKNNEEDKDCGYITEFRIDPYCLKNIMVFSLVFIIVSFFIFLVTISIKFVQQYDAGSDLFLIAVLLFFLVFLCVYIVKSKIFD